MKIVIEKNVTEIFPHMQVCYGIFKAVDIESITDIDFTTLDDLDADLFQREISCWKQIYNRFPHNKKARVSIDYLYKSYLKGKIRNISKLVDLYNYLSLMTCAPFGAEDYHSFLNGDLSLALAGGTESFTALNSVSTENPLSGEIVWKLNQQEIVCRSMNYIESDKFKLSGSTNSVLFLSEQPLKGMYGKPEQALSYLQSILSGLSQSYQTGRLNKQHPQAIL